MEKFVLSLCGLWFWLTRKYRTTHYNQAAGTLNSALNYLSADFCTRASTRDRGFLLPHHAEAIAILERHAAVITKTSLRFDSLVECCRYVTEELVGATAVSETPQIAVPQRVVFTTPVSVSDTIAEPATPLASFAAFWSSEGSGPSAGIRPASFSHATIIRAFTRGGESLSQLHPNRVKSQIS